MEIDGKKVFFVRSDGTLAENGVGEAGIDKETGEILFYEIVGNISPKLNGKKLYRRVLIRRVFPCISKEDEENDL